MTRILVVDNYDSFVHTLAGYLAELGAEVAMMRNDEIAAGSAAAAVRDFDAVLISPGPGRPADAGISAAVIRASAAIRQPVLGVCLGHQVIAEIWGARVGMDSEFMHGRTSAIDHDGVGIFRDIPAGFRATRYHSLAVDPSTVHPPIRVSARAPSGTVMALRHQSLPIDGVQFHPESIMTEHGHQLLANWLDTVTLAQQLSYGVELPKQ